MSLWGKIGSIFGGPPPPPVPLSELPRRARGRRTYFDSAGDDRHHLKHWSSASDVDPNTRINADLAVLQKRATYEASENPTVAGIIDTYWALCCGQGPRLQLRMGDDAAAARIEDEFGAWAMLCERGGEGGLPEILRLGVHGLFKNGALLLVRTTDPDSPHPIKLKYSVVATERLMDPWDKSFAADVFGGVLRDRFGKPVEYYIQRQHPGSLRILSGSSWYGEYDTVPAADVIHYRHQDAPQQSRGIPWLQPSLTTSAQLRDWWLATLDAAKFAAYVAGVLKSTSDQLEPEEAESMDLLDIERSSIMTLPQGWDVNQLHSEHPPANFKEFKAEATGDLGRPVNMPRNIAGANSENYNYASGRLDHQTFFAGLRAEQYFLSIRILNRMLADWLREASLIRGFLPGAGTRAGVPRVVPIAQRSMALLSGRFDGRVAYGQSVTDYPDQVTWFWPAPKHVDPEKEANAQEIRLGNGMTSYGDEYAEEGKDWERQFEQRAREIQRVTELAAQYGCEPEQIAPRLFGPKPPKPGPGAKPKPIPEADAEDEPEDMMDDEEMADESEDETEA